MKPLVQTVLAEGLSMIPLRSPTILPATHTNCFVVGCGPKIVVDPGGDDPDESEALAAMLKDEPLEAVFLTHHHPDHIAGASQLAAALKLPIWAHRLTDQELGGLVEVDRFMEDEQVLELGQLASGATCRWRLLHTPGHASGHLCLVSEPPQEALQIVGDMVSTQASIFIGSRGGDMLAYLDQLQRLADLAPSRLFPSHGPPSSDPVGLLKGFISHRLDREARVLRALEGLGRATVDELLPIAYKETPDHLRQLAALTCEAHLIKLVSDHKVRREGDFYCV